MGTVGPWLALTALCYLLGSFPSAYLLGRLRYKIDIRSLGDGNPGTENVWRTLGPPAGLAVALADTAKGVLAVFLARLLVDSDGGAMLGGLAAVAGHNWPLFLGFRGGRGAATLMGVMLALLPKAAGPLVVLGGLPLAVSRSTTVFFAFLFVLLPPAAWLAEAPAPLIGYVVAMAVLVGVTHAATARRHGKLWPRGELRRSP
jgi:glycerol-3-phosphate acyltransferase PlsY